NRASVARRRERIARVRAHVRGSRAGLALAPPPGRRRLGGRLDLSRLRGLSLSRLLRLSLGDGLSGLGLRGRLGLRGLGLRLRGPAAAPRLLGRGGLRFGLAARLGRRRVLGGRLVLGRGRLRAPRAPLRGLAALARLGARAPALGLLFRLLVLLVGHRILAEPAWPRNLRVGANSPSLWPTIASVTNTGTCFCPSCTAMVWPTISGKIVEVRDQVLIICLLPDWFMDSMRASRRCSTHGPFLLE